MPKKKKKKTKVKKRTSKKVKRKTKVKKRTSKKVKKKTKVRNKVKVKTKITNSSEEVIIKTKPEWIKSSLVTKSKYQDKYSQSIKNNNEFWKKEGKRITWIKPYKKIKDVKYSRN